MATKDDDECQFGVFGMGTMGQNLALNVASRGYVVAAYNRPDEFQERIWGALERAKEEGRSNGTDMQIKAFTKVEDFVKSLRKPRRILLSIPAGKAVDDTIDAMLPFLDADDVVIDGGNEHFENTERRSNALMKNHMVHLVGMGISGGASGARHGPSLMPGCSEHAYDQLRPILESMAAKVGDRPCVTHVGLGGSGHFVKMVHNGIEYAEMQYLAEAYTLFKQKGLSSEEMRDALLGWNDTDLQSYLVEITTKIVTFPDDRSDGYVLDKILDAAGSKGTGKWTVQCAADLGIASPCISAALEARFVSAQKALRVMCSETFSSCAPDPQRTMSSPGVSVDDIADALMFGRICAYAQGLHVISSADKERDWKINLVNVASIWQGGCIIRAKLLEKIVEALKEREDLPNLLLSSYFSQMMANLHQSARKVVVHAIQNQIPVPALAASVTYFDGMKESRGSANLIQAQRDYFGAHTYKRIDADGSYHTDWK